MRKRLKIKIENKKRRKRKMKKILISVMVIAVVASVAAVGASGAWFSSTATNTGNTFTAGTMDLELSGGWDFSDIKPCEDLEETTVTFGNIGPNPGYLYNKIEYIENDEPGVHESDAGNLNADQFAALIYVANVTYQHYNPDYPGDHWGNIRTDELDKWLGMDLNDDDYVSLYEMNSCGWLPYDDGDPEEPLAAGEGGRWVITFHMADSLVSYPDGALLFDVEDNWPQADGIDLTWTAVLKQTPGPPTP
jgi:hypothetical protein